jgi:hypothetical protein
MLANYFDLAKLLARHDRKNYPIGRWYLKYLKLALRQPNAEPFPLP